MSNDKISATKGPRHRLKNDETTDTAVFPAITGNDRYRNHIVYRVTYKLSSFLFRRNDVKTMSSVSIPHYGWITGAAVVVLVLFMHLLIRPLAYSGLDTTQKNDFLNPGTGVSKVMLLNERAPIGVMLMCGIIIIACFMAKHVLMRIYKQNDNSYRHIVKKRRSMLNVMIIANIAVIIIVFILSKIGYWFKFFLGSVFNVSVGIFPFQAQFFDTVVGAGSSASRFFLALFAGILVALVFHRTAFIYTSFLPLSVNDVQNMIERAEKREIDIKKDIKFIHQDRKLLKKEGLGIKEIYNLAKLEANSNNLVNYRIEYGDTLALADSSDDEYQHSDKSKPIKFFKWNIPLRLMAVVLWLISFYCTGFVVISTIPRT